MSAGRRLLWGSLALGTAAAIAVAAGIATRQIIVGSSDGHWIYPYIHMFGYRSLRVALIATLTAAALSVATRKLDRRSPGLVACGWVVLGFAIQVAMRSGLTPIPIDAIFANDLSNSFYNVTLQYPARTVLRDFAALRATWPLHAQSNMPGKILLIYGLEVVSTRPDVLAWLVAAASSLGGVFVYLFVRDLFRDVTVALYATALYVATPATLLFLPLLNTVTPVVVFICAVLLLRWLRSGHPWYAVAFGSALYALLLFEPTAAVMGLMFAGVVGLEISRGSLSWGMFARQSAWVVLGFAAVYMAMRVAFRFDLFDALMRVIRDGVEFNGQAGRPYGVWVRQNLLDFFFGVGAAQAVIFWAAWGQSIGTSRTWAERLTNPMVMLGTALTAVLIVLDLIGANRGEVVRLWIFLACAFQIPAAYACARLQSRPALLLVLATTFLQNALATSMMGFITL